MCHEWSTGQRVMLDYKIRGKYGAGEILEIDGVTADETQYLLIVEKRKNHKRLAWVWESRILGLCYDQLEMAL